MAPAIAPLFSRPYSLLWQTLRRLFPGAGEGAEQFMLIATKIGLHVRDWATGHTRSRVAPPAEVRAPWARALARPLVSPIHACMQALHRRVGGRSLPQ